jgi:glutamate synthase domain-containing protein 3
MVAVRTIRLEDARVIRPLLREHLYRTSSPRARAVLAAWDEYLPLFRAVSAKDRPATAPVPAEAAIAAPARQP